jgi:glycosyltransferase involved in cell wall biosynthesis
MIGRLYRRVALRWLHRAPASIWGIGQTAVTSYQLEFGRHRRYQNIPYFSNLHRFAVASGKPTSNDGTTILFSGSFIHRKGVDLLARAFLRTAEEHPHIRLKLLGDGPLLPWLRTQLAPVAAKVEYLGFKDWSELPAVYATADVLCAPSRHDGWGLIVPEGLAAGLPVISTTQTGAAVEFIKTDWNGWLIPPDDEESLFRALCRAAELRSRDKATMARRARDTVAGHQLENGAGRFVVACRSALQSWNS